MKSIWKVSEKVFEIVSILNDKKYLKYFSFSILLNLNIFVLESIKSIWVFVFK